MSKVLVQSLVDYNYAQLLMADHGALVADEPRDAGGDELGPDPYKFLLWSLGACTSITLQMYARRKEIPLLEIAIEVEHQRMHARDCHECVEDREGKIEVIYRRITVRGEGLTEDQREDLLRIAARCPVHRTLGAAPEVVDSLEVVE